MASTKVTNSSTLALGAGQVLIHQRELLWAVIGRHCFQRGGTLSEGTIWFNKQGDLMKSLHSAGSEKEIQGILADK